MKTFLLKAKAVPRWVILLIDLAILASSFAISYFVVKFFVFPEILRGHFIIYTGLYCVTALSVFYFMRIHTGLIRFSNIHDMFRIFSAVFLTSFIYPIIVELIVIRIYHIHSLDLPKVLMVNFFISSSLLIMLRTAVKGFYHKVKQVSAPDKKKILIYGSDFNAILIKQAIESGNTNNFIIAGFIETDSHKINTYIQQKRVYHFNALSRLKEKSNIENLILMNQELGSKDRQIVIEQCLKLGIKVLTVPTSDKWIYGELNARQIQELKIEDLLQREPIVINNTQISGELKGKTVLITGAAGSIGSEMVRQVLTFNPGMLILCDQAESALHEIQLEMEEKFPNANIKVTVTSIQNLNLMLAIFKKYRPQIIFHAAAYKHVPMMEEHPSEAILNNVMGTKNIADLAILFEAEKFVMISTDKAVNPTNIMGASKRIAEMYIQSLNNALGDVLDVNTKGVQLKYPDPRISKTKFITTRFGNVLGSNGSVIPRFRAQIQKGGPITVTHPEITRYFMTIPEAVQLVLEAGTMGQGGEIFIFDMGKPVKIVDMALKMIQLADLTPHKDIQIVFTGLRPGEKLYEELLNKEEKTLPTHHNKIKIARIIPSSSTKIMRDIDELINISRQEDNYKMVKKMKELVPEFISKNSQYESLDHVSVIEEKAIASIL